MYLLKPFRYSQQLLKYLYSHSTMYLLKRISITSAYRNKVLFTFHHVSIKTLVAKHYCKVIISFTFHHVSIKTKTYACCCVFNKSFTFHHVSIKTLLKRYLAWVTKRFTFHHVSIKTFQSAHTIHTALEFTFHHVSIKTLDALTGIPPKPNSHSTMYLLKPSAEATREFRVANSHSTMYLLKRCQNIVHVRLCNFIHIPPCIY